MTTALMGGWTRCKKVLSPQVWTEPSVRSATEWRAPAATWMTRGASADMVVVGLRDVVGVLLRVAVCVRVDETVLDAVAVDTPGTSVSVSVGVSVLVAVRAVVGVIVGLPRVHSDGMVNCPASLLPQPTIAPLARSAKVWLVPAARATMRSVSVMARGCERFGGIDD